MNINCMKLKEQERAKVLRRKGYTLNEIRQELGVSKSSVSVWVRDVPLSSQARARINSKITEGQRVAREKKFKQTEKKWKDAHIWAQSQLRHRPRNINLFICTMLFWCEGTKNEKQGLFFTNSDPELVAYFLRLLRKSFDINEKRFRVCVHLHEYHNMNKQLKFWSKTTTIPTSQFMRPYLKPNTKKRYRDGYPGCVSIRYYDNGLVRKLLALGRELMRT